MAKERPVLNPTLRLLMEPTPIAGVGRGKMPESIRTARLPEQRRALEASLLELTSGERIGRAAGRMLVVAKMFSDSLAPTHTPRDLFSPDAGCRFVSPVRNGYLIEVEEGSIPALAKRTKTSDRVPVMSDISRVRRIKPFDEKTVLRGQSVKSLWSKGLPVGEGTGRLFTAWMMPYHDDTAREVVLQRFSQLAEPGGMMLPFQAQEIPSDRSPQGALSTTSVGKALREYRQSGGVGRGVIVVESERLLRAIVASGTVFRMDPVRRVSLASAPTPPSSAGPVVIATGPTVAIVDGGMNDPTYAGAEAWRAVPIVADEDSDLAHGNAIASLVTHASDLNPNLNLPELQCRFGVAQAVPHPAAKGVVIPDHLFELLNRIGARYRDTRVWNLSFNLEDWEDDPEIMSDFGHQISISARAADALPIISIGNVSGTASRLLPPGDAEAAITVGGRTSASGFAGPHCNTCCSGPGPGGALKPEVSWFSPVEIAGGQSVVGSSYATALVSSLAAHTFEKLKDPNPDLVRALLIGRTERFDHDPNLGWGSPFHETAPWECEPGGVTMAWTAGLLPGFDYYWQDVPVPPEMILNGKIVGSASLTAVLRPLTSPFAEDNYFATRVEVGLQYKNTHNAWDNLLGTMKESTIDEETARADLKKWQPIRHHKKKFARGAAAVPVLRVRARLYTRDLFQATLPDRSALPPQRVAFALTLKGSGDDSGVYNSMVQSLGAFVDSAVIDQSIFVEG